jgi:hypothetical protein
VLSWHHDDSTACERSIDVSATPKSSPRNRPAALVAVVFYEAGILAAVLCRNRAQTACVPVAVVPCEGLPSSTRDEPGVRRLLRDTGDEPDTPRVAGSRVRGALVARNRNSKCPRTSGERTFWASVVLAPEEDNERPITNRRDPRTVMFPHRHCQVCLVRNLRPRCAFRSPLRVSLPACARGVRVPPARVRVWPVSVASSGPRLSPAAVEARRTRFGLHLDSLFSDGRCASGNSRTEKQPPTRP